MVDSKHNSDNYENLKINTGAIIKDPEILKFVPDYLKTNKMCKNAVKKLPFIIKYIPGHFKTKEMCDKVVLKISEMLFTPDWYKYQKCMMKLWIIILMH